MPALLITVADITIVISFVLVAAAEAVDYVDKRIQTI